jgi:hypothetical protein
MKKGVVDDYFEFMLALSHDSDPDLGHNLAVASCENEKDYGDGLPVNVCWRLAMILTLSKVLIWL